MKQFSKTLPTILTIMLLLLLPCLVQAQGPGDPGGGGDPGVPIDGGASLILAAGIGYGAKKLKDAREKKNKEVE